MQVVKRSGGATHHVEFSMDDNFAERLRQLRSLVPPLNALNKQRDLVIDKVRVRLPTAVWRCGGDVDSQVEGSCIVIAAEGFFNCGGKDRKTKEKLVTYTFPIARLIELHMERPAGETFYIRDGIFTNDEPAEFGGRPLGGLAARTGRDARARCAVRLRHAPGRAAAHRAGRAADARHQPELSARRPGAPPCCGIAY